MKERISEQENCLSDPEKRKEAGIVVVLLYIFWIILNGRITVEILLTGLAVAGIVFLLAKLLFRYSFKKEIRVLKKSPYFVAFAAVLFVEVLKANLAVMRLIPRGEKHLSPVLVTFRTDLKSDFCRYLFANSITLTPGTITVEANGDVFTVHCLSRSLLDTGDSNRMLKLLKKMEA